MQRHKEPLCVIDGIECYTRELPENYKDYPATGLDNLYAAEKDHFWFISRRERILDAFSRHVSSKCHILEIGAGTGHVARGLQDMGYRIAVGDIHLSGLRYAKKNGISECYQFNLLDPPFQKKFDAIGMFDVLEHLEDDVYALTQVSKMLRRKGKLFITVPAHQWLWNRDDSIAGHKRRYSKKILVKTFEEAGMKVIEVRFFFITILPLLYLRHLFNIDNYEKVTQRELKTEVYINPLINKLLIALTRLENRMSKWLPNIAGGSLLLVATREIGGVNEQ